ncbi:unnamed protein product [Durusdinium trenchii]|uniref:Uncharacterized protein n=1 Tax=Durusdinium trenchii TaxID=1381693 RepID=A0ABP0N503_9DINO
MTHCHKTELVPTQFISPDAPCVSRPQTRSLLIGSTGTKTPDPRIRDPSPKDSGLNGSCFCPFSHSASTASVRYDWRCRGFCFVLFRLILRGPAVFDVRIRLWPVWPARGRRTGTTRSREDRLEKVHDYTMKCQNMEEELVGPRPEWGHVADAAKLMENSVSARINKVVRSSGDLSAACDKVLHLIGSPTEKGVGAEVHGVVKSLDDASHRLHDLTFGHHEEEVTQAVLPLLDLPRLRSGRRRSDVVHGFL